MNFGNNGLTQFANSSGTTQVSQLQQNGFAAGQLESVAVAGQNFERPDHPAGGHHAGDV